MLPISVSVQCTFVFVGTDERLNSAPLLSVPILTGSASLPLPLPGIFLPFAMLGSSIFGLFGFVLASSFSETKPFSSTSLIV